MGKLEGTREVSICDAGQQYVCSMEKEGRTGHSNFLVGKSLGWAALISSGAWRERDGPI